MNGCQRVVSEEGAVLGRTLCPLWLKILGHRSRGKSKHGFLNALPCSRLRIDQIKMACTSNLQKMNVFFLAAWPLLLLRHIVTTERGWNRVVVLSVNQPLPCMRNRQLHRISLAIVVRHLGRSSVQKLNHRIVAEVKLIRPL